MNEGRYRVLAVVTCIGMLLVLLAGALVTNTGSGRGCGDDWPLCNGKFIPAYTVESLIEYSHRLISGAVGLLVLASFIATLVLYRKHREPVFYASGAGVFTIVQAVMGALAVVWPQSSSVLALHFGFSILAFAFTLLLVLWALRLKRGEASMRIEPRLPRSIYGLSLAALVFSYVVIYLGAFVRHTQSYGGCLGWPLCNGKWIPAWEGATRIVFTHRLGAAALFLLILWLLIVIVRTDRVDRGIRRSGKAAFILVCCQVLSGALLTYTLTDTDWFIFTSMLHNLIVAAMFGVLADLTIRSWKWSERREGS
nr:COX15/CtaA family protein [Paenibacillus humicola]